MKYFLLGIFLLGSVTAMAQEEKFSFGASERIRQEYLKEVFDLDTSTGKNRNYFRFRTSLWGQYDFSEDLSMYAKLTNENRAYAYPSTKYDLDEFIFDNLYVDIKDAFDLPVDLRIGRQNLVYGEGFLLIEGTPLDGSRTIYFNAVKASIKLDDWTVDLLGIRQDQKERRLPAISENNRSLVLQKEEAWGVYGKYSGWENICFEPYYLHKEEKSTPKVKLDTLGSRFVYTDKPWTVRSEAAYQFGDYGEYDNTGLGGYLFFDYEMKDLPFTPVITTGYMYLSGDDPDSDTNEAWNPLFSHWPGLSEVYAYMLTSEKEIGYWTNTQLYNLAVTLKPTEKLCIKPAINYLMANENTFRADSANYSYSSKSRGWNPQVLVTYKFNDNVQGHLLFDYFHVQDYYAPHKDDALLFRWQVEFKI